MSGSGTAREVAVVLVRPHYPGNVGAVVRVAANFGVRRVHLVAPQCTLEDPEFIKMAMGGQAHVELCRTASLPEAVASYQVAIATTSGRARDPRPLHTPTEAAAMLAQASPSTVALVFGPEGSGLSAEELSTCHLLLAVPTNPSFPVLNLAQAVAVVLALLAPVASSPPPRSPLDTPASAGDFAAAVDHLCRALLATGFLDPANPARVAEQLRRLLGRAFPTARELAILRGIASHLAYLAGQNPRQVASGVSPSSTPRGSRPVTRRKRSENPSVPPADSSTSTRSIR